MALTGARAAVAITRTGPQRSVPAGGLFTGAELIKTIEQQQLYGGSAKAALDTCYHRV